MLVFYHISCLNLNLTIWHYSDCLGWFFILSYYFYGHVCLKLGWATRGIRVSPRRFVPMRYSCPWWKTGTGCWVFESCSVNHQWHIVQQLASFCMKNVHVSIQISTGFANLFKSLMQPAAPLVFFQPRLKARQATPSTICINSLDGR